MQVVLNTFGLSLRREGEMFVILSDQKKLVLAAKVISSIVVTNGIHFSSDAILLALEYNIEILFLDRYGNPVGRFWTTKMGSTASIRRAQLELVYSQLGNEIVIRWILAKLRNHIVFLQELVKKRPALQSQFRETIRSLQDVFQRVKSLSGPIEEIRMQLLGLEGAAANLYWRLLGMLPPQPFRFLNRSQHPATDPFNAMLNYAYGVLYGLVERSCILAGLDPYVGILHTDNYNKKSLVYDLIEPFRIWCDRVVLKLFTTRQCREDMFNLEPNGSITLQPQAKELLLTSLNNYLDEKIYYRCMINNQKRRRLLQRRHAVQAEAHTLANSLLGKKDISFEILETEEIFRYTSNKNEEKEENVNLGDL